MAEEQDDIDLREGFSTLPIERSSEYFGRQEHTVLGDADEGAEPGYAAGSVNALEEKNAQIRMEAAGRTLDAAQAARDAGDPQLARDILEGRASAPAPSSAKFVYDPDAGIAAVREAEKHFSPSTEAVSADEIALTESILREARLEEMKLSRPGHDEEWYKKDADKFIYQKQFTPSHLAPAPPERPDLDIIKEFYSQARQELRFGLHSKNAALAVYNAIDDGKSDEEINELLEQTKPSQWPDSMTMGAGFTDAMGRAFRRRVIDVPVGGDTPAYWTRIKSRQDVAREMQATLDNEGPGAAFSAMLGSGPSMSPQEATRAGMEFDDEATARELAVTTTIGAIGGAAVGAKNLGFMLPRAGTLGRTAMGLRGASIGARAGTVGGPYTPVTMTVGFLVGGAIGYAGGKLWGKVDASEFIRPVPLFNQDADDDGFFFAVPAGLVNLSSRTQTLMGLSDSVWVPMLTTKDEDSERMRDILAESRPSEAWNQIVQGYRAERKAGATPEELRERLLPDVRQMVRNVSWNDLPGSAKFRDHLDLQVALDYAKENSGKGDTSLPRFTFEYFIGMANERDYRPQGTQVIDPVFAAAGGQTLNNKNMQTLLESLPLGQILRHVPEIIADEKKGGAIPSFDSFLDGIVVAAGDTVESIRVSGGETTEDLALGFGELMFSPEVDSDGQMRYVENTPGKIFRVAAAIPEVYNEFRLPFDLPITPASRDFRYGLGIRDPDTGFSARILANIATGEVGLGRHFTDEMLVRGVDRQSGIYRGIATASIALDSLIAWERPIFSGVGMPIRGGLRGASASKLFKDSPYRGKAILAAISPDFYQFRNNVDLNANRGVINVREALGENSAIGGLNDLKAGKVADENASINIGIVEQGILDFVIPLVETGKSVDEALDLVPRAAKGDMYQVLNHLVEQQIKQAHNRGEDIYQQVPLSMRAAIDSVFTSAGIDPTAARMIQNDKSKRAKLIHANATERLLNQGSPDIQILRASDEYKAFKSKLIEELERTGDDVQKINSYMPYLELKAYLEAINPSSRFKTEIEFFGSLVVKKTKSKKPKEPGPDSAPPATEPFPEPVGPRPIDPDQPLPEPFETEGPADIPPDYLDPVEPPRPADIPPDYLDPVEPPGPFDAEAPPTKDWDFVEMPGFSNGGYWRSSAVESVLVSPPATGVTVFSHSNSYGVTTPIKKWVARPTLGPVKHPVAHASKGGNQPYMTLYKRTVVGSDPSVPDILKFEIATRTLKQYGITLKDLKEMYTGLVDEALREYKKHLDRDPDLDFAFSDELPLTEFRYRKETIEGEKVNVVTALGRLRKTLTFSGRDAAKLKLYKDGTGTEALFTIKTRELSRLRKQAREAAKNPDVVPPSVEVPTSFSAGKKKFLSEYEKVVKEAGIEDLTAKLGRAYIEILPDKAFSVRRLQLYPLISGSTVGTLFGEAMIPTRLTKAGNRTRLVSLYGIGKRIIDSKKYKLIDLTKLEPEALYEHAVKNFWSKEAGWDKGVMDNRFDSELYADRNFFVDQIGPIVQELSRREVEALGSGVSDLGLIDNLKARLKGAQGNGPYYSLKIDRFVDDIDLAIRNHEYFRVGLVHTLVHELTHVLHMDVLSADELIVLRKAYLRERDAGFLKWNRSEQFRGQYDKEVAFAEWFADTTSDYWISGNVQRHASFTPNEINILRRSMRRMAALFKQIFEKITGFEARTVEFPPEIIDLVDRLSRQAAEETTGLVGVTSRDEFFTKIKGVLGPFNKIEPKLDSLNSEMFSQSISAQTAPDWVTSIAAMAPDKARMVATSIAREHGAVPGTKKFDDAVDYMISNGQKGRLFDGITDEYRTLSSASAPSPSPRSAFKIVSERIATADEVAASKKAKSKKIVEKGQRHSPRDVMYSYQGDALFRMLVEGDIDQLFKNEGVLLRGFLNKGDFNHLIKEAGVFGKSPRLTAEGEALLISTFKSYIETGKAPGPLRGLYDQIYLNLQGYWLRFTPDRQIIANPKIRKWFDVWLAADLNVRPMATEITGKVLSKFRKVRIADVGERIQRLEEGRVASQGKKSEFFRIPLDTPTVRNALRITADSMDIDVTEAFARAAGYVAGEYARITSGGQRMFPMTYRSIVPLKRVKQIKRQVKSRFDSFLGGEADYFSQDGFVILTEKQASSMRIFLRSLSNEPLANIIPHTLLSDDVSLRSIPNSHWRLIDEALIDIEAGPNSTRQHYSELMPPTLAFAAWNALKQMAVNSRAHSDVAKAVVNKFREMFVEVNVLADVGPAQRAIIESVLRELSSISPELRRAAADAYKGNKDLAVQQLFLMLKDTIVNKPIEIQVIKTITGKKGVKRDITSIEYIMGVRGDVGPEGAVKHQEGILQQLQAFRKKVGTDEMEGAPAARRQSMLIGEKAEGDYAPPVDPFGEVFAEVPYIDFILSERKNLQTVMQRPYATHHTFPGLDEYDAHSLMVLEDYHKKLKGYRAEKAAGKDPALGDFLKREDFDNLEEALSYVYDRLERQKTLIGATATKIAEAMGGGQQWSRGDFDKNFNIQGEFYQMFHKGEWAELYEVFQRKFAEVVGTETKTKRPALSDPETAITQMIAGMRAQEILTGLTEKMVQYGMATDVRNLTKDFFTGSKTYQHSAYGKVNKSLFLKRIEFYLNQEVNNRMVTTRFRLKKEMIEEPPMAPHVGNVPMMTKTETTRAQKLGAPTDFNGNVHDLEAYTKALEILNNFGFKRGRVGFERVVLPDGAEVFIPSAVRQAIDEAIDRATGAGGSRNVTSYQVSTDVLGPGFSQPAVVSQLKANAGKAVDKLMEMFPLVPSKIKMGITTGLILPNPAYFTGVFMGAGFQAMQGVGAIATGRMMLNPRQTGAVVARLWKDGSFKPNAGPVINRRTGAVYSIEEVTRLAEAHGLKSSYIHAETMNVIAKDLKDMNPGFVNNMRVGRWAKKWQKTLIESATALDNYWRVSVFIDGLKKGMSPDAAAALARKTGYDYASLTKWEKNYARNTIIFYSYMRKNMDLFWDTLLTNPERILGQLRLLNGIQTAFLKDDAQLVLRDYQQTRLPVFFKNTVINTHKNSQVAFITPPLPLMDALNFYIEIFDIAKYRDEEAIRGMASRVAPWVQGPFVMATGKDIFWNKELNEYNKVPSWLVELDLALTGGALVHGVLDIAMRPHRDPSKSALAGEAEEGWFHARNGKAWWVWRNLMQIPGGGRSMDTITYLDRANTGLIEGGVRGARGFRNFGNKLGLLEEVPEMGTGDTMGPRSGLSEWEELLGSLGMKPVIVPTLQEVTARSSKKRLGELKQAISREKLTTREY